MFSTPLRRILSYVGISLAAFGLMLLHQSDNPVLFGRYSATYLIQLGVMLACIVVSGGLAALAYQERLPDFSRFIPRGRITALVSGIGGIFGVMAVWIFLPGARFQPGIALFSVYVIFTLAGLWLWWMKHVLPREIAPVRDAAPLLMGAAVVLAVLLNSAFIGRVPRTGVPVTFDEAWLASWGVSMYRTGQPFVASVPQMHPGVVALQSVLMPLEGAWLETFGITLAAGRWFWLLWCWLSAPFVYLTAKLLYGRVAGAAAFCLAMLLPLAHAYTRPDVLVPFPLAAGLYFYLSARHTGQRWRYFAAGMALAATAEGHPLAARFALVIGLLALLEYAQMLWKTRRWQGFAPLWGLAAGGFAYLVIYAFLHTVLWGLPLSSFLPNVMVYYGIDATVGQNLGVGTGFERVWNLGWRWILEYLTMHPLEWGLFGLAAVFFAWRRTRDSLWLAAVLLLSSLLLVMGLPKFNVAYWIHHMPLLAIGGGGLLAALTRAGDRFTRWHALAVVMLIALLSARLIFMERDNTQNLDVMLAAGYQVEDALPSEIQRVAGWGGYYYGLHQRRFYSMMAIDDVPGSEWRTRLGIEPPQAVVLTRGWDSDGLAARQYIEQAGLVQTHCFPIDIYGREVMLFLPPEYAPSELIPCR